MPRRTLAILLAVTVVVAFVAILPRTPPGRAWLLGRLTSALDRSGVSVRYRHAAGDLWTGVELEGASVVAPGVHLSARALRVRYFLPSLISGALPLSVTVDGVRGSVDVRQLPSGGGGGGLPIRPRLQELTVSDVSVVVQKVPYSLPDGAVSHVSIRQKGAGLAIDAQLTTADGSADVAGTLDLGAPSFDGQVVQADVRLARHWFRGASAGTVSGPIHAGRDGVRADLTLQGGALDAIGLHPHGIHGSVQLRYPLVRADVQGTALGGDVSAQGVVNIAARHWTAHAHGGPQLLAAARWLARSSLAPGASLPLHGSATTTLDAEGWTSVRLNGDATGSGSFAGLPLADLQADYSYDTRAGVKVEGTGRVAGGAAVVTAATGPQATTIEATAKQMAPFPGNSLDLQAQLSLAASGPTGSVHIEDRGTLLSRPVTLSVDGGLNGDGWQAAIHGQDAEGARLEGAVALSGGKVSGQVQVQALALPALSAPLTATLRADGEVSALPLTLTVGGDRPVALQTAGEALDADLRGRVSATLAGARLERIDASLGPLVATGELALAPLTGKLAVSLAPTPLTGPVRSTLGLDRGTLDIANGHVAPRGTLTIGATQVGPLTVPAVALAVSPAPGRAGGALAAASANGLQLAVAAGRLQATFRSFPLELAGVPARVDGRAGVPLEGHLAAGLASDLTVKGGGASLALTGTGPRLTANLQAQTGTSLGPFTLARPLHLGGGFDAGRGEGTLQGQLGGLPLRATLALAGGAGMALTAGSGDRTLTARLSGAGWRLHGALDVAPLAGALGLPVRGAVTADLAHLQGSYTGSAELDASAPMQGRLRLTGSAKTLRVDLSSALLGRPLRVSGTLQPSLALTAGAGPLGPVTLRDGAVHGSGTLPAQALGAGVTLQPVAWSVEGTLSPLSLDLRLARHGGVHLDTAGGARLAAALQLPLLYGGHAATLALATAGSGPSAPSVGAPAVRLAGRLTDLPLTARLVGPSGQQLASAGGTPAALTLQGSVPAGLVAAPLPKALRPAGTLSFHGTAHLAAPRTYHLDATWSTAADTLHATISGSPAGSSVSVHGGGLTATLGVAGMSLAADHASLAPLFPDLPAAPVVDGALSRDHGRYDGALKVTAALPGSPASTVTAVLEGQGATLGARASGSLGPLALDVQGTVLPSPRLHARLRAWNGAATASVDTRGSWRTLALHGTVATQARSAGTWLQVPARTVAFDLTPGSGALDASGDGVALSGSLSDLQGSLQVPFQALGAQERLDLTLSGPLTAPRVDGSVAGRALTGTLSGGVRPGLQLDLVAHQRALAPLLPHGAALLASDVEVTGSLQRSGAWQAQAAGALAAGGTRLPVRAALAGSGAAYSGTVDLMDAGGGAGPPSPASPPDTLARAAVAGTAGRLHASIDLAGVDYPAVGKLLGVPLQLDASGALALATDPLSATLQVEATGTAAGHRVTVSGHARRGDVALDAGYGVLALHLAGTGPGPLALRADAAPARVHLAGTLSLGATDAVSLRGQVSGETASLDLGADLAGRSGRLRARLGNASLRADAAPGPEGLVVSATASARPGGLAPIGVGLGGALDLDARVASGSVVLQRFELDLSGGPAPVSVRLAGPAYPDAKLAGSVAVPAWHIDGGLSLSGSPAAVEAGLTLGSLALHARTRAGRLARVDADGRAQLAPFGRAVAVRADRLTWASGQGFQGDATLRLEHAPAPLPGSVVATLHGDGPLNVTASAGPGSAPWARLAARLAADPAGPAAWQGALHLNVPVQSLARLPGPASLTLTGAPVLSGGLLRPELRGPVTLGGAASADGTLTWRGGSGHLALSSPTMTVDASLTGARFDARATLDGLPLAPFVPALRGAQASLRADIQGGPGTALSGNLSALRLALPGATLTGTATLHDGIRAALQASADLSAMQLPGPPLQGAIHGPLVLAAPDLGHLGAGTLIAELDVAGLGPRGTDATVDGTFQVGGSPSQPVVSATLQGSGQVHGQLRANAAVYPRRASLHSTLSYRSLSTDLDLTLQAGSVQASGHAAVGNAEVHLATSPGGALQIRGANALEGWSASVAAALDRASLTGPLDGLGAGARGQLHVALGGTPWLDGSIRGAALAGAGLGDLTLSSATPGASIRVDGPHLQASLDPTALDWHAVLSRQPLFGGTTVSGEAKGHAASGTAVLTVGGALAGQPVDVRLQATRDPGISIDGQGALLAGTLALHVSRPAGSAWQGSIGLTDAALGGVQASVQGKLTAAAGGGPRLDAAVDLRGAVAGTAAIRLSAAGAQLNADVRGGVLGGELKASGRLAPNLDLTLAGGAGSGPAQAGLHLFQHGGVLRGEGSLQLPAGPARVVLRGGGRAAPLAVAASVPAVPGLAFQGQLPADAPLALVRSLARHGLSLEGTGKTRGSLSLQASPTPQASLRGVSLELATLTVSADGTVAPGSATVAGSVALPSGLPVDHLGGASIPYRLAWKGGTLTLRSSGPTGSLRADLAPASGSGRVTADLHTLGATPGTATVDLTFDPKTGASGTVKVHGVTVSRPELPGLTLGADVTVGSGAMSGSIAVRAPHGGLDLSGRWGLAGWLPSALTPQAQSGGNAEVRVSTFDLSTLPTLQRLAPHLSGSVSGVVRLRDHTVVGQLLVPDLKVADTALPLDAQISGTLGKLDARIKLGSSVATATLQPGSAKGLLQLQSFPAQVLAEATTGATGIKADIDGVMRFDVPYRHPAAAYLRMATQQVTLERAGVTTTGNLSWVYNDRSLDVVHAAFEGRGSWQAKGTVDASTLDFQLSASNADFTPLLDLVPMFAHYGVGASGSFSLDAKGSPADPEVSLSGSGLEARVAGTHYRIENLRGGLKGRALSASAHVVGVAPLGGSVDVKGKAQLSLAPLALSHTDFAFSGDAELPVVGTVTDLSGGITQQAGKPPQLALSGKLGNPFTIRGSLAPFDVTLAGSGLNLKASPLFITSSTVDANVRLKGTRAGLTIGGELDASEVHMNIGAPAAPGQPPGGGGGQAAGTTAATSQTSNAVGGSGGPGSAANATAGTAAGTSTGTAPGAAAGGATSAGPGPTQQSSAPAGGGAPSGAQASAPATSGADAGTGSGQSQAARAARESVIFDHLHLKAPQRVLLDAGFGTAEVSLDLDLTGTAAAPKLDGTAKALRGTLTFAGRDFTIDQATAGFQASRGVYPTLDVQAHSDFDKQRVLSSTTGLTFAAPRDSSTFQVTLSFSGQVQPTTKGPNPVTFDIQPTLSSNALVQATSASGTSSPRPLSDSELLSLVTLGRLGVSPQLAGQGGFGTAVAQSALDTAVDVLVVSELQNALSKALGIDVVQIQTTPLSSLLENNGQPFGVALRVGGYLTPELFASYRLGNYNGVNGAYGFTNEVSLSYDLGPLNFDLSGRLSFPDTTPAQGAVPELGVGLRYAFTNNLGLEAGIDLSDLRKQAHFGVSLNW